MEIDISFDIEAEGIGCLSEKEISDTIRAVCCFTAEAEKRSGAVGVIIVDNNRIREINKSFRSIDRETDVLSFPSCDGSQYDLSDGYIGDIAISIERVYSQAIEYGHSPKRELAFLAVHGMLHILGYDHIDPNEEKIMLKKQEEILMSMGITREKS